MVRACFDIVFGNQNHFALVFYGLAVFLEYYIYIFSGGMIEYFCPRESGLIVIGGAGNDIKISVVVIELCYTDYDPPLPG